MYDFEKTLFMRFYIDYVGEIKCRNFVTSASRYCYPCINNYYKTYTFFYVFIFLTDFKFEIKQKTVVNKLV